MNSVLDIIDEYTQDFFQIWTKSYFMSIMILLLTCWRQLHKPTSLK